MGDNTTDYNESNAISLIPSSFAQILKLQKLLIFQFSRHRYMASNQSLINEFQRTTETILVKTSNLSETMRQEVNSNSSLYRPSAIHQVRLTRQILNQCFCFVDSLNTFFTELDLEFAFKCLKEIFCLLAFLVKSVSHLFLASIKQEPQKEQKTLSKQKTKLKKILEGREFGKPRPHHFDIQSELIRKQGEDFQIFSFSRSQTTNILTQMFQYIQRLSKDCDNFKIESLDACQIKKSLETGQQMMNSFSIEMKNKFIRAVLKLSEHYVANYIKKSKKICESIEVQTEQISSSREQALLIRELRQKNLHLSDQNKYLKQKLKQTTDDCYLSRKKIDHFQSVIAAKISQMCERKSQYLHEMGQKNQMIGLLRQKIRKIEKEKDISDHSLSEEICQTQILTEKCETFKSSRGKSLKKMSPNYYEKQLQTQRKFNIDMRNSLKLLLSVLNQNNLIAYDPIQQLDFDLKDGKMIETLHDISLELSKELQKHKHRFSLKESSLMKISSRRERKHERATFFKTGCEIGIQACKEDEEQLQNLFLSTHYSVANKKPLKRSQKKRNSSHFYHEEKQESIKKKENRAPKGRRTTIKKQLNKLPSKMFQNFSEISQEQQLGGTIEIQNQRSINESQKITQNGICFEQINIKKQDSRNKKNFMYGQKINRSLKNFGQFDEVMRQAKVNGPIIAIQGFQTKSQVMKMIKYLERRNDQENRFLKKFLGYFMEQVKKKKWDQLFQGILMLAEQKINSRCQSSANLLEK